MKQLLKMSKGNKKLKKTLIFDLPAGKTCPNSDKCRSYAVMNNNGKLTVKDGDNTILDVMPLVRKHNIKTFIMLESTI